MNPKIAVAGATGRMGQQVIAAIEADPQALFHGGVGRADDSNRDLASLIDGADVVIDFTLPAATQQIMAATLAAGAAYVLGTTGHGPAHLTAIAAAAKRMPILHAANFSLGMNVLLGLVNQAAKALPQFDLEILELHHNQKVDAPSGTALALGHAAAAGRGIDLDTQATYARHGETGARAHGEIGFATLRGGDNPGEHAVLLIGAGERLELRHQVLDRLIFAKGAVTAAIWLHQNRQNQPGLYTMAHVLGLAPSD